MIFTWLYGYDPEPPPVLTRKKKKGEGEVAAAPQPSHLYGKAREVGDSKIEKLIQVRQNSFPSHMTNRKIIIFYLLTFLWNPFSKKGENVF